MRVKSPSAGSRPSRKGLQRPSGPRSECTHVSYLKQEVKRLSDVGLPSEHSRQGKIDSSVDVTQQRDDHENNSLLPRKCTPSAATGNDLGDP